MLKFNLSGWTCENFCGIESGEVAVGMIALVAVAVAVAVAATVMSRAPNFEKKYFTRPSMRVGFGRDGRFPYCRFLARNRKSLLLSNSMVFAE